MHPIRKLPRALKRVRSSRPKSPGRKRRMFRNVILFPKVAATALKRRRAARKRIRTSAGLVDVRSRARSLRWNVPATGPVCQAGDLEVYITRDREAVRAAQALRYTVFYEEMAARPSPITRRLRLDIDRYDDICDHLIVMDRSLQEGKQLVGSYRLLRGNVAAENGGFYSADEYDLSPLMDRPMESLLELGRSCVAATHRSKATIQLLWRGIAAYVGEHDLQTLFGCASFQGRDPNAHAKALSYLRHYHGGDPKTTVRALDARRVEMEMLPGDELDKRRVWWTLPPLIKAYLRLGGVIGDGAVIDDQFGTIDVFVLVELGEVGERYYAHFDKRNDP